MSEKNETKLFEYTITDNLEISPGVHLIAVKRDVDFLAGQVVKIALNAEHAPRIYSVCSGNNESEIKILFNIKDDGFLTPKLAACIPGDKILMSKPYGSFTGTSKPAWWIATGTGIAPFYSMFRSGLDKNKTLIHGVRYLNQFYFEDEFEWALGNKYIRCCSVESSCNAPFKRVTHFIENCKELPNVPYYICGKALMVVEVRDMLIARGVSFEKIFAEIYF